MVGEPPALLHEIGEEASHIGGRGKDKARALRMLRVEETADRACCARKLMKHVRPSVGRHRRVI